MPRRKDAGQRFGQNRDVALATLTLKQDFTRRVFHSILRSLNSTLVACTNFLKLSTTLWNFSTTLWSLTRSQEEEFTYIVNAACNSQSVSVAVAPYFVS